MKKKLSFILAMIMLLSALAACGTTTTPGTQAPVQNTPAASSAPAETGAPEQPTPAPATGLQFLSILTGQLGGGVYNAGLAMASAANAGQRAYKVEALPTSGQMENANMLFNEEAEIAVLGTDILVEYYNGLVRFENQAWDGLRSMFPLYSSFCYIIVPENSSIQTWADMKGKKVGVGNPGSSGYFLVKNILAAHGLNEGDYTEVTLNAAEQTTALKDGHLDVFGFFTTPNSPAIVELATTMKCRWMPIDKAMWDPYAEANRIPFIVGNTPAGTYTNQDTDVPTLSGLNYIATREGVSEDAIYTFTKAFFENYDMAVQAVSSIAEVKVLLPVSDPVTPMHPGAVKYFEEVGLDFNEFAG